MNKLEYCFICDQPTGGAGKNDDSLYDVNDKGPYCPSCWNQLPEPTKEPEQICQGCRHTINMSSPFQHRCKPTLSESLKENVVYVCDGCMRRIKSSDVEGDFHVEIGHDRDGEQEQQQCGPTLPYISKSLADRLEQELKEEKEWVDIMAEDRDFFKKKSNRYKAALEELVVLCSGVPIRIGLIDYIKKALEVT